MNFHFGPHPTKTMSTPEGEDYINKVLEAEEHDKGTMDISYSDDLYYTRSSSIICDEPLKIEKGTTIKTSNWEYKVKDTDKNLTIKGEGQKRIQLEVIDKEPESKSLPSIMCGEGNIQISNISVYTIKANPAIVLTDDYYKCYSAAYHNYYVQTKSRTCLYPDAPENELVALSTLREDITEKEFRKYLLHGFLLVKGTNGNIFQIFRSRNKHIKEWVDGQVINEICVRICDQAIPITDSVIAMKTIIETDTEEFKKLGNVYKMAEAA